MEYGDVEHPNLYQNSVLRKAKQQLVDSELGLLKENDPILSISNLKYSSEHQGSIHSIGLDPFFLHYWTPTQEHIYQTSRRQNWITQYIDATGSLVLLIVRTKKKISSAHIFLYQIVIEINGNTIPVTQQLSEKQNITHIYFWLRNWMNSGMKIPNEIVSDYSKAILGAISRAYCEQQTIKEYINTCFEFLLGVTSLLPNTFIRVDVAHVVHMICRWKCLNGRKQIKDFYIRCIGILIKSTNIHEFGYVLKQILIVSLSETDGYDNECLTPSEIARVKLIEHIATGKIMINESNDGEPYKGIEDEEFFVEAENHKDKNDGSQISEWINNIYETAKKEASIKGNRLNTFYRKDLIKPLFNISREFPL